MQMLVAMEQQETTLCRMQQVPGDTSLQFPWAMGVLTDDTDVTFMYMTSAPTASHKHVYVQLQCH